MVEVSGALLKERLLPTCEMVTSLIRIEQAYINTNHPDFLSTGPAFQAVLRVVDEKRRRDIHLMSRSSASLEAVDIPLQSVSDAKGEKDGGLLSYLFKTSSNPPPPPPIPHPHSTPQQPSAQLDKRKNNTDKTDRAETLTEKEEFETQLIMTLLHNYFCIVKRNIIDSVPKACMHFLVNHVIEQLPSRLIAELYKEELFGELLKEDETMAKQRRRCRKDLEALQEALNVLGELRDA